MFFLLGLVMLSQFVLKVQKTFEDKFIDIAIKRLTFTQKIDIQISTRASSNLGKKILEGVLAIFHLAIPHVRCRSLQQHMAWRLGRFRNPENKVCWLVPSKIFQKKGVCGHLGSMRLFG